MMVVRYDVADSNDAMVVTMMRLRAGSGWLIVVWSGG